MFGGKLFFCKLSGRQGPRNVHNLSARRSKGLFYSQFHLCGHKIKDAVNQNPQLEKNTLVKHFLIKPPATSKGMRHITQRQTKQNSHIISQLKD